MGCAYDEIFRPSLAFSVPIVWAVKRICSLGHR